MRTLLHYKNKVRLPQPLISDITLDDDSRMRILLPPPLTFNLHKFIMWSLEMFLVSTNL
jgi:hypothetical protein